jgi:hypothetical protein
MFKRCFNFVAAVVLTATTTGAAQAQRLASMDDYLPVLQQGRIRAEVTHLALGFRVAETRYRKVLSTLSDLKQDGYTAPVMARWDFARAGDSFELSFGSPGVTGGATGFSQAVESVYRRTMAGQEWEPRSSERFLREARLALEQFNRHIQSHEAQVERLRKRAVLSAPTTYYRICPNGQHYRH